MQGTHPCGRDVLGGRMVLVWKQFPRGKEVHEAFADHALDFIREVLGFVGARGQQKDRTAALLREIRDQKREYGRGRPFDSLASVGAAVSDVLLDLAERTRSPKRFSYVVEQL